ncbi:MAG: hypothetical protein ACI8W8_005150 [Rhodothermales bacterium]
MNTKRIVSLIVISATLLLCGCGSRIEAVQQHAFVDGRPLSDVYADLLDNVEWQSVLDSQERFVQVSGVIKGGSTTLSVRYNYKAKPPVMVSFTVGETSRPPAEFASFLSLHAYKKALLNTDY